VLLHGDNGQGKSNLLEALYLLAVPKSQRAEQDRDLLNWSHSDDAQAHTQVAATIHRDGEQQRIQIDLVASPSARASRSQDILPPSEELSDDKPGGPAVQKLIRINGAPRRAAELVGEFNAVMFSAQDMDIVYGPPQVRRRYLDVLLSQQDRAYLRALQRYQRVLAQRNSLLKRIREGRSKPVELDLWDERLAADGGPIMARRRDALGSLATSSQALYAELASSGEEVGLEYMPAVPAGELEGDHKAVQTQMRKALIQHRSREIAAGFTLSGPHRDDFRVLVGGEDAARYGSRGQSRTAVLALKLAEAQYLSERRGQSPVLLLDDVLSELDASRRRKVLDKAETYDQAFITTAELGLVDSARLARSACFGVKGGAIEPRAPQG
jgi:DNA replication and repair protein RecF